MSKVLLVSNPQNFSLLDSQNYFTSLLKDNLDHLAKYELKKHIRKGYKQKQR